MPHVIRMFRAGALHRTFLADDQADADAVADRCRRLFPDCETTVEAPPAPAPAVELAPVVRPPDNDIARARAKRATKKPARKVRR